jgi:hypothetical protein
VRTTAASVEGLFALHEVRAVSVLACPFPPSRTCVSGMTVPLAGESRTPLGSNSAVDPKGGVALPGWFLGNSSTAQAIDEGPIRGETHTQSETQDNFALTTTSSRWWADFAR